MENYGIELKNYLKLAEVDTLPDFDQKYYNNIIFDKTTKRSYIGSQSFNKWVGFDLSPNSVQSYSLDLDINMVDVDDINPQYKISARILPALYKDKPDTIQNALTDLENTVKTLTNGTSIKVNSIKCHHIDKESELKVDAECLSIRDKENIFTSAGTNQNPKSYISIDDAITQTYNKTADKVKLTETTDFGDKLGFDDESVETALTEIEGFLYDLSGIDVVVNCPSCPDTDKTKLQYVVDDLYTKLEKIRNHLGISWDG